MILLLQPCFQTTFSCFIPNPHFKQAPRCNSFVPALAAPSNCQIVCTNLAMTMAAKKSHFHFIFLSSFYSISISYFSIRPELATVVSSSYIHRSNAFSGLFINYLPHPLFSLLRSNWERKDSYHLQALYWLQLDLITAIESTKKNLNPAVTYGFCYLILCILVCDTVVLVPTKEVILTVLYFLSRSCCRTAHCTSPHLSWWYLHLQMYCYWRRDWVHHLESGWEQWVSLAT